MKWKVIKRIQEETREEKSKIKWSKVKKRNIRQVNENQKLKFWKISKKTEKIREIKTNQNMGPKSMDKNVIIVVIE